ncbi:MAG: hypothetical protein Q7S57_00345 [bacterium]|nr:hypothetical protein [bacterium]
MTKREINVNGLAWKEIQRPLTFWQFHLCALLLALTFVFTTISGFGQPFVSDVWTMMIFGLFWLSFLLVFPSFVYRNIIGMPIYIWRDGNDLQVRRKDWWLKSGCPNIPLVPVLQIWIGGWFRSDRIFFPHLEFPPTVRVKFGIFSGRPKRLRLRDCNGDVLDLGYIVVGDYSGKVHYWLLSNSKYSWNESLLYDLLVVLEQTQYVSQMLTNLATCREEQRPVAGRVGT